MTIDGVLAERPSLLQLPALLAMIQAVRNHISDACSKLAN